MRRNVLLSVAILATISMFGSAAQAGVIYVTRAFDAFGTVDLATGTYTPIATTAVQLNALTFAPNGTLYGVDSNNNLYQVNITNGALSLIGPTNAFFGLTGLAARSDGGLFATDSFSSGLGGAEYRLDPTSGMASKLGQSGLSGSFVVDGGLAFGPGDNLYMDYGDFASNNALYTVNQTTGVATKVGNTGFDVNALVFSGGQAYGFDFFGEIYRINSSTGAATDTGVAISGGGIDAAAAPLPTPEPASLILLAVGGAGVAACAWRRR